MKSMSNKKEFAIGEEVTIQGKVYICTAHADFDVCADTDCDLLRHTGVCKCRQVCDKQQRTDGKDVIFKLKEE